MNDDRETGVVDEPSNFEQNIGPEAANVDEPVDGEDCLSSVPAERDLPGNGAELADAAQPPADLAEVEHAEVAQPPVEAEAAQPGDAAGPPVLREPVVHRTPDELHLITPPGCTLHLNCNFALCFCICCSFGLVT